MHKQKHREVEKTKANTEIQKLVKHKIISIIHFTVEHKLVTNKKKLLCISLVALIKVFF